MTVAPSSGGERHGARRGDQDQAGVQVLAVNTLGLPAVAIPVGIGLPQVVRVIGSRYREDLCLDAAAAIEDRPVSSSRSIRG